MEIVVGVLKDMLPHMSATVAAGIRPIARTGPAPPPSWKMGSVPPYGEAGFTVLPIAITNLIEWMIRPW